MANNNWRQASGFDLLHILILYPICSIQYILDTYLLRALPACLFIILPWVDILTEKLKIFKPILKIEREMKLKRKCIHCAL